MQGQCGSTNYYCREQEKVVGLAGLISGDWYAHALLHAIIGGCGLDLPKSGAAMAAPAAPLPTPLTWWLCKSTPGFCHSVYLHSHLSICVKGIHFTSIEAKKCTFLAQDIGELGDCCQQLSTIAYECTYNEKLTTSPVAEQCIMHTANGR